MAKVTIEGKDYELDELSEKAKGTIVSLQFVQTEIKRLEAQLAVYKTAEVAYLRGLKNEMEEK
tara:strand:+ start:2783 stop:2971 length:189 start_codon:yes stop_codon:yes gene_type:complete